MRALFSCALAIMLSFGRGEGQSGTIVYGWVASLDVEGRGGRPRRRARRERRVWLYFTLRTLGSGFVEGEPFSPIF